MTDQQRDQEPDDSDYTSRIGRSEFDSGGNADNDGGTSGDYIGGQSGMRSELGGGVSRDMGQEMGSTMGRDEGKDMGAGRDATGKRYMGGDGEKPAQEEKRNF